MDGDEPLVVNRPRLVKDFIDLGVHGAGSSFSTPRSSALAGGIGRSDEHSEARCSQSTKSLFDLPLQLFTSAWCSATNQSSSNAK